MFDISCAVSSALLWQVPHASPMFGTGNISLPAAKVTPAASALAELKGALTTAACRVPLLTI